MTEQDKVTVDDIIGIVKTEEQTNSVEEVRKLRGRENKTAKRFKVLEVRFGEYRITDKGTIVSISDACKLLNKYNITCKELEREVELLSDFILSKGYTLDDFNKYLCNKWSDVE